LQQRVFVLDVGATYPCLDLVAQALQFLDFLFEVDLELFLLILLFGAVHLFPYFVEQFDALVDLFQDPIYLGCCGDGNGCVRGSVSVGGSRGAALT
jgi:hypothetical protein